MWWLRLMEYRDCRVILEQQTSKQWQSAVHLTAQLDSVEREEVEIGAWRQSGFWESAFRRGCERFVGLGGGEREVVGRFGYKWRAWWVKGERVVRGPLPPMEGTVISS